MPEGPEVKYMSLYLKNKLNGDILKSIVENSKVILNLPKQSKIIDVNCKGKFMWIETEDYYVYIQLGLTGWFTSTLPKYTKYVFRTNNNDIYLDDPRRLSSVSIGKKENHEKALEKWGIDILTEDFTLDNFTKFATKKGRMIAATLLDQYLFSGIGNYIKNDALYIAKINPYRKSNELTEKEIKKLRDAIRFVAFSNLLDLCKTNNITVPKYIEDIKPTKLKIPYEYYVYGKETDSKGREITYAEIGGRGTYYVDKVQK